MAKEILLCVPGRRRRGRRLDWLVRWGRVSDDISRGLFAGEVGVPRLLDLFERSRPEDELVHPRPLDRDLPGADEDGRRRRP